MPQRSTVSEVWQQSVEGSTWRQPGLPDVQVKKTGWSNEKKDARIAFGSGWSKSGVYQSCSAVGVCDVRWRIVTQKDIDARSARSFWRPRQRRRVMSINGVYQRVGTVDQGLNTVDRTAIWSPVQCRVSVAVPRVDVSTSGKQQFNTLGVLTLGGIVERCPTITIHCIHLWHTSHTSHNTKQATTQSWNFSHTTALKI